MSRFEKLCLSVNFFPLLTTLVLLWVYTISYVVLLNYYFQLSYNNLKATSYVTKLL